MKKIINKAASHPLITGSAVIIFGSMAGNVFNYLFTLAMGRFLTVGEYGIMSSLISLFNIFVIFATSVTTIFSKFAASFVGQGNEAKLGTLFRKGTRFVSEIGLVICLPLVIFAYPISGFLHINQVIFVIFVAISLFFSFLSSVVSGILQGVLNFSTFSAVYTFTTLSKFIFGLIFGFLGWHVFGSTFAIVMSALIGYGVSYSTMNRYLKKKEIANIHIPNLKKELVDYGVPVLLSGIGLTLMYTMDIILVKHFFSEEIAGQYGALSLMGRCIFFIVSPITYVFFPLITQKMERKEKLFGTLMLTIAMIGVPSIILSSIYFIFPKIILHIFFPAKGYAALAPYLGMFSIFILLYTFVFFLNSFYLSIKRTEVYIFTLAAALAEISYIAFFHNNLWTIIYGLTGISFLLFLSLLIYYFIKR